MPAGAGTPAPPQPDNIMITNEWYAADRWRAFAAVCGPMRARVRKAELAGNLLPPSPLDPSVMWCPPWNMKGLCNGRCGKAPDHGPHTKEQDAAGYAWARLAVPEANAPEEMAG